MASKKQILANRRNSLKSTRPKTPEGKRRSAQNARFATGPKTEQGKRTASKDSRTHGLSTAVFQLEEHHRQAYAELLQGLILDYDPQDAEELMIVEVIAQCIWKMKVDALPENEVLKQLYKETGSLNLGNNPKAAGRHFSTPFYETRDCRRFHRALALLRN